jgi:hypothetical protein
MTDPIVDVLRIRFGQFSMTLAKHGPDLSAWLRNYSRVVRQESVLEFAEGLCNASVTGSGLS